jgi:phage terminase large subunit-like protein
MDNDGDAVFIYTPLTLRTRSVSKARDPQHAAKMFKAAQADTSGRWATFHFASHENPFISQQALEDISRDLSSMAYRQEILAEDVDEPPGGLWKRNIIDAGRVEKAPALVRVVVAVDPAATGRADSDETGIVVAGVDAEGRGYVLKDASMRGSPSAWAAAVAREYEAWQADRVVAEVNNGGDMVEQTVRGVEEGISYRAVRASRGKDVRAEPVSARYERGLVHHVGAFNELEDQMCGWVPGQRSPDRMDALVWALTDLMLGTENPDNYVFAVA